MKFRKDKDILKLLGVSLGFVLIGIIILQFIQPIYIIGGFIGGFFISCGLIGFIIGLRIASKPENYFKEDERSLRIKEKAGHIAYGIMVSVAAIIMLLKIIKLSPSLTPSIDFLNGALFIGVIGLYSFLILEWYYNKKGEV